MTLVAGVMFSAMSQTNVPPPASHDVALTAIKSDSILALDSTVAIKVFAENRSKNVVEAIVSLVDSVSNDTIEKWYPLFPPESADSIVLFWNTKGKKAGNHVLAGSLLVPAESATAASRLSHTVTVVR